MRISSRNFFKPAHAALAACIARCQFGIMTSLFRVVHDGAMVRTHFAVFVRFGHLRLRSIPQLNGVRLSYIRSNAMTTSGSLVWRMMQARSQVCAHMCHQKWADLIQPSVYICAIAFGRALIQSRNRRLNSSIMTGLPNNAQLYKISD